MIVKYLSDFLPHQNVNYYCDEIVRQEQAVQYTNHDVPFRFMFLEFESSNKGAISMGILITIILLAALGVVGIVTLIVCCCRRQRRNAGLVIRHPQQPVTQQSVQSGESPSDCEWSYNYQIMIHLNS